VRSLGCLSVGVARRSGTGGARRKYVWLGVAICQTGARYGAPRVEVPGGEMQSQPLCRSGCMLHVRVCQKCRCLGELVLCVGGMSWVYTLG